MLSENLFQSTDESTYLNITPMYQMIFQYERNGVIIEDQGQLYRQLDRRGYFSRNSQEPQPIKKEKPIHKPKPKPKQPVKDLCYSKTGQKKLRNYASMIYKRFVLFLYEHLEQGRLNQIINTPITNELFLNKLKSYFGKYQKYIGKSDIINVFLDSQYMGQFSLAFQNLLRKFLTQHIQYSVRNQKRGSMELKQNIIGYVPVLYQEICECNIVVQPQQLKKNNP